MKKIFKAGICTMTAVMLLTGCSGKDSASATGIVTQTEGETAQESTAPLETEAFVAESSVEVGEYKGIAVTMPKAKVEDEELNQQLQQVLEANAETIEVDREAKDGDTVNIDYKGLLNGEAFEGGTDEGSDLVLGSKSFIEGFESGLLGAKKGEKRDLNLKFPEGYHNEDLSGKDVVFQVTVNAVKETQIPELTDEFVQTLSTGDATVAEFKENFKNSILEQKKYNLERQRNIDLMEAIMAASEVVCATELVDKEYETQLKAYTEQATMYGMDLASMASMMGMDENALKSEIRAIAKDVTKQKLIYAEIAKQENIAVTDEDRLTLAQANSFETVDELIGVYGKEMVEDAALSQKVLDFLLENAKITETD